MKPLFVSFAFMSFFSFFSSATPLTIGDEAPQVSGIDENGSPVVFADVYAKGPTLVYFYPRANTPGCTAQACSLRDASPQFTRESLTILGVSRDKPEALQKFKKQYALPFTLIADTDGKIQEAFGVSNMLGLPAANRQSFLIKDGKIAWISTKAKTKEHAQEVQAALDALQK